MVRNCDSELGLSFESLGLEMDLSTLRSSSRTSRLAARTVLLLSELIIRGCLRRLVIRSL